MRKGFLWALVVMVIIAFVSVYFDDPKPNESTQDREPCVQVVLDSWIPGGFGTVGIVDLTISNICEEPVKDVEVEFTMFSKSETFLGSKKKTIYEIIPGNRKLTLKKINTGFLNSNTASLGASVTNSKWTK
jgi:hypothetical protein